MRYHFLCFFFVLSISAFCQEKTKLDTISIQSINNTLNALEKRLDRKKIDSTLTLIKKKKAIHCIEEGEDCENFKEAYAKGIKLKMIAHFIKDQRDSVIYYYPFVKENSSDPNLIGYTALMAANAKQNNLDYTGFLALKDESIAYYKKANNHLLNFGNYYDLIFFYLECGSINNAAQSLRYLELELESLKNNAKFNEFDKVYKLVKANYLKSKSKYDESIAVLREIDTNNLKRGYEKWEYYNLLYTNYLKKNTPKKALEYYNKIYNKEIESFNVLDINYKKNFYGATLFEELKDENKYESSINALLDFDIKKDPYKYKVNILLSKYYVNKKDYKKAFEYLATYKRIEDSLNIVNENILKEITIYNLRKDKELETLELKNEQKEAIIKKDKKILIAVTIILLLVGTFLVSLIYFIKSKRNYAMQLKLEKSEEVNAVKNIFLENISHEVRTPITIINGYLSLLKESILEPKTVLSYANLISKNTDGLINSLNNYLTVFKTQNGSNYSAKKEIKDLNAFCKNAVLDFKGVCEVKKIDLYYKTNVKKELDIEFDYHGLQKVMYNIISNAIKYSNADSTIYVAFEIVKNGFQITVKDEGIGISKEEQEQVFERFYQSSKHLVTGGFGIGLSLVHQIIQNSGGNITLKSELNVGSVFTITLPLELDNPFLYQKEMKATYDLLSYKIEEKIIDLNLPKALIVDDNIELIQYYENILSTFLQCSFAFNGKEALVKIKTEDYDIIISDLRMPIMDGAMLKNEINKIDTYKSIPFVMVTAVGYDFSDVKNMTIGINDHIVKPFEKNEIIVRVKALLENKMHIKKILATETSEEVTFDSTYSDLLEKVNNKIHKNLNNTDFDVKTLASECGYTQRNLNKILQKATGLTLVSIVLEVRLQKAYEYIVNNSDTSLGEIMFETGFNSRPYFYKKFENRFGIKPGELKKKMTSSINDVAFIEKD